jgi:ribosome-associated translation inhibitor RaiA
MAVDIHKLIAAISPDAYCKKEVVKEVRSLAQEKGYLEAADKADPVDPEYMDLEEVYYENLFDLPGLKNPIEKHKISYEAQGSALEPIYFYLLDEINARYGKSIKLIDNFIASPGSSHFAEMGTRSTRMQEESMKMLGNVNQVLRSVLNIIYDLKEFKLRLSEYERVHSKDKNVSKAAKLSLKQIWLDTVDMKRGNTAIKALALGQQSQFVTLIDAFMITEDESLMVNGEEMDLNDRVKNIIKQRIPEFNAWIKESERELKKRFEIEKQYLKSQVNSVKLYARWIKPYLKASRALEQNASSSAALVTSFNTALFELSLLGLKKYDPDEDLAAGDLPSAVTNSNERNYQQAIVIDFKFRTIPERSGQQYSFSGGVQLTFTSYCLTDEEVSRLQEELDKDDVDDVLSLIEGVSENSLEELKLDIEELTGESEEKESEEPKEKKKIVPSFFKDFFPTKEKKESENGFIKPDSAMEKVLRSRVILLSRERCNTIATGFKRAYGMPKF